MATEQSMKQAMTQGAIEAAKAALMVVRDAESPINSRRPAHVAQRESVPAL